MFPSTVDGRTNLIKGDYFMAERLLAQIRPNKPIGVGMIKIWSTRPGMLDSDQIISGTLCICLPACWGKQIIRSHSKWDLVLTYAFLLNHFLSTYLLSVFAFSLFVSL